MPTRVSSTSSTMRISGPGCLTLTLTPGLLNALFMPHRALGFGFPSVRRGILNAALSCNWAARFVTLLEISVVLLAGSTTGFRRQLEPLESACGIRQVPQPPRVARATSPWFTYRLCKWHTARLSNKLDVWTCMAKNTRRSSATDYEMQPTAACLLR
jgi:hypothetical protein